MAEKLKTTVRMELVIGERDGCAGEAILRMTALDTNEVQDDVICRGPASMLSNAKARAFIRLAFDCIAHDLAGHIRAQGDDPRLRQLDRNGNEVKGN
jgi:hypothetical protein